MVLVVAVGMALVIGYIGVYTMYLFIFGGLVYGVVGMILIGLRWVTVPRRSPERSAEDIALTDIHQFRTAPQRVSFALDILLLVNIIVAIGYVLAAGGQIAGALIVAGGIAQAGAVALVIANAMWAYPRRYILGEHEALTHRLGRHRLILTNRVLSYSVWVIYTVAAMYVGIEVVAG